METQIVNHYEYRGLGSPVTLKQVQLVNLRGDWYPKIGSDAMWVIEGVQ